MLLVLIRSTLAKALPMGTHNLFFHQEIRYQYFSVEKSALPGATHLGFGAAKEVYNRNRCTSNTLNLKVILTYQNIRIFTTICYLIVRSLPIKELSSWFSLPPDKEVEPRVLPRILFICKIILIKIVTMFSEKTDVPHRVFLKNHVKVTKI